METEYNITGRIFIKRISDLQKCINDGFLLAEIADPKKEIKRFSFCFQNISFVLKVVPCQLDNKGNPEKALIMLAPNDKASFTAEDICNQLTNDELEKLSKTLSERFCCQVYVSKSVEHYGVANVFNGGSDYEVVNEDWDLFVYQNGQKELIQHTKQWNEKTFDLEQEFLELGVAKELKNFEIS